MKINQSIFEDEKRGQRIGYGSKTSKGDMSHRNLSLLRTFQKTHHPRYIYIRKRTPSSLCLRTTASNPSATWDACNPIVYLVGMLIRKYTTSSESIFDRRKFCDLEIEAVFDENFPWSKASSRVHWKCMYVSQNDERWTYTSNVLSLKMIWGYERNNSDPFHSINRWHPSPAAAMLSNVQCAMWNGTNSSIANRRWCILSMDPFDDACIGEILMQLQDTEVGASTLFFYYA